MKRILEPFLAGDFRVKLHQDPWRGLALPLSLEVCSIPTCDCQKVRVTCPDPDIEHASLGFTVGLVHSALAGMSDPARAPFFEAVVAALLPEDWARLQACYYLAKEEAMERADLGSLPVVFPEEVLAGGGFVGYLELIPSAMPLSFVAGDLTGQMVDLYKVGSDEDRTVAVLRVEFYRGKITPTLPDVALGAYDYAKDQVLEAQGLPKKPFRQALDKLRGRMTDLERFFAVRHERVKALYAFAKVRHTPVRATHIGRNDPCPCGSGRKYKRCCLS